MLIFDQNRFRSFERTAPICFQKLLTNDNEEPSTFLDKRRRMFSFANTHSLIDVIHMGESLTNENVDDHVTFFKEDLGGLVKRLPNSYSAYRLFSHKVSPSNSKHL